MYTDSRGYDRAENIQEIKEWCHKLISESREHKRNIFFFIEKTPGDNSTVKYYPLSIMAFVTKNIKLDRSDYDSVVKHQEDNFVLEVALSTHTLDYSVVLALLITVISVPEGGWYSWTTSAVLTFLAISPSIWPCMLKWCVERELIKDGIIKKPAKVLKLKTVKK